MAGKTPTAGEDAVPGVKERRGTRPPRVLVIGAGVVGLSCAVRLAEAGYDVHVFARDLPLETTSAVAAALWYPYRAAPPERVSAWSATSYRTFLDLAESTPAAGVRIRTGRALTTVAGPPPSWADAVPNLRAVRRPPPGYAGGWEFEAPVVDTSVYLPWLVERLTDLGGTLTRHAFAELPNTAPVIVNCAGLAARKLTGDHAVIPVRGQICYLEQIGLSEWVVDETDPQRPLYVVPRLHDIVVGGTAEEGDWERMPRPETTEAILTAARRLVPELAAARVLGQRVGLRPYRPSVRLEAERTWDDRLVVHCYGHGGAGVTMSWGCADEVMTVVREHVAA